MHWLCNLAPNATHERVVGFKGQSKTFVYNNPTTPFPLFVRYIYDCGTAVKSESTAQHLLAFLNDQHDTIEFEFELPNLDGFLPFLDLTRSR